jgi:hypothetical protein
MFMRITRREALGGLLSLTAGTAAGAAERSARLGEASKGGEIFTVEIQLALAGRLTVDREDKPEALPIEAKARHKYREQVDPAAKPIAIRHYFEAESESSVAGGTTRKKLADDRKGIFVYRDADLPLHVSPAGPLSRDQLELAAEHFDSLVLPSLLPGKELAIGETWSIPNDAVQLVFHFDGLIRNELVGKLVSIAEKQIVFAIDGTAEGIEHGAKVSTSVAGRGTFNRTGSLVEKLEWVQVDRREAGPVSPAMEAKVSISMIRQREESAGKEIEALAAKRPSGSKVPELWTQLRHVDPNGYEFVYPRDWHIVVKNDKHLVLRLLQRGEYVAQATFAAWKPSAGADEKAALGEFVEATRKQPGWEPEKVIENGLMTVGEGKPIYRISARGKQDGVDVIQAFYLLSGQGRHLAIASVCNATAAEKLGGRDAALVAAVEFTSRK